MKLLLAVVVVSAVLVCIDSLAVMSVDIGSEFMKVAIVKPGVPMEIALNKESKRKTPVVVYLKDGERLIGDPALSMGIRYPKYAYKNLVDLLGKKASNPLVTAFKDRYPYYNIEAHPETGLVTFRHDEDTVYTVEELIGMVLEKAKEMASEFCEQPITEAVITIPAYFNQAERRAMLRAGDLAKLKILQIINDNTAVALNFGVFRRKEFNDTAVFNLFFDMGSSSTTATIVGYQVVKAKNPTTQIEETFPQLSIKGIGFDRSLGGQELQLRLRDHLAKQFTKVKKTSSDVYESPRAMEKLYKEAGRLKHVLSANADHFAQIEGLLDDEDFRTKVTRDEFEAMNADVFERVSKVVEDALKSSEITLEEIGEVILMGGGTRVPKVQEYLLKSVNRQELSKNINTDEAAALGASYQAAHLSKGYKVKKFGIKDANIFPIQVEFERVRSEEDSTEASKMVKRTLFGRMNPFPQKKIMTFNKHSKDFQFSVNYGDLSFLSTDFLSGFGKTTLQEVALIGVEDAHNKHSSDKAEPKGTKAHFRMDDNGILTLDKVESTFDKTIQEEVEELKEESTLSKIGSTISSFFGGGGDKAKDTDTEGSVEDGKTEAKDEERTSEEKSEDGEKVAEKTTEELEPEKDNSNEKQNAQPQQKETEDGSATDKEDQEAKKPDDSTDNKPAEEGTDTKPAEEKKPVTEKVLKTKQVTVKEEIKSECLNVDVKDPRTEQITESQNKLTLLRQRDEEKQRLAAVKNELEAFIFDTQDKLYQDMYAVYTEDGERTEYLSVLSEASDWLYEQEDDTDRQVYEKKLRELKKMMADMFDRVKEATERPRALEALNSIVNYTEYFLAGMRNLSQADDGPFTTVEVDTLTKLITDTKDWNKTVLEEQAKVPKYEKPKLTVDDIAQKINALDREVKYLLNKMKSFKPKPKPKAEEKTNSTKNDKAAKEEKLKEAEEKVEKEIPLEKSGTEGDTEVKTEKTTEEETLQLPRASDDSTAADGTPEPKDTTTETPKESTTRTPTESTTGTTTDKSVHGPNDEL